MSRLVRIVFDPHAVERAGERGANRSEVEIAVASGERFAAKFGRAGFRRTFPYNAKWRGRHYLTKQVEVYAVPQGGGWLVVTVLVKYF